MITAITNTAALYARDVAPKQTGAKQKNSLLNNPIFEKLAKEAPDKAAELQKKIEEWERTKEQLEQARVSRKDFLADLAEKRKQAARAEVERLKKELQTLQMLAMVNPKAAARRLAQISKELSAAVKEYAQAGGSGVSAGASGTVQMPVSENSVKTDGATQPEPAMASADNVQAQEVKEAEAKQDEVSEDTPVDAEEQNKEVILKAVDEMKENHSSRMEDLKFQSEVNIVKNMIKGIAATVERLLKEEAKKEMEDVDKFLEEVSDDLKQIVSNIDAVSVNVNVQSVNVSV